MYRCRNPTVTRSLGHTKVFSDIASGHRVFACGEEGSGLARKRKTKPASVKQEPTEPTTHDCFAKRLQVQERLTLQIGEALVSFLEPKSVGVIVRCRHLCMESRGIRTPGEETFTSAMLGELQSNLALRTEFLAIAHNA